MAEYIVTTEEIATIANAIRSKNGETDKYTFNQLPNKIKSIPSGGEPVYISSSKFDLTNNYIDKMSIVDFETDGRFELSDNGYPWSTQELFSHNGNNMYSANTGITHYGESSQYIKNISDRDILFKVYYQCSSEGGCDWGNLIVNNYTRVRISGTVEDSEANSQIISFPANKIIKLSYTMDWNTITGKNNVGFLFYEIKGGI